jgi:nicotinate-nucleotide adenylyltransferase
VDALIRRLGILGGTFDPVHHGHLVAAEEARYQLELDRVLFVPAGEPPHKPKQPITAAHHRLRMLELAIGGRPGLAISRVDVDRPGPSYTVDSLQLLRTQWGSGPTFFFIEGADSLADILTWHEPQRLIELCELAVVGRPGVELDRRNAARERVAHLEERLPGLAARLHWVQMPYLEISSSDLRSRVKAGRPIFGLVPPAVEAYIEEEGLYRTDPVQST